jgi:hypothetical protein
MAWAFTGPIPGKLSSSSLLAVLRLTSFAAVCPVAFFSAPAPSSVPELVRAVLSLLSYALRLLGERARAEDVVQEAFMKLHAQFSEVREPRRWLYRTGA